ncbi:MAG: CinA family protein [Nitrospirae bacterium]|nr:MAG: CinA family protein [Nitrospirota bacterium]
MYSDEVIERVSRVHQLLIERGVTLATSESCTGGRIADLITEVAGASKFFRGSVVAYHEDVKREVLGVKEKTIRQKGVVSEDTALQMARGVKELLRSHVGVSTTGNLGPQALEGKEVGLVYIGIALGDKVYTKKLLLKGNREENKLMASLEALEFLIEKLEETL